MKREIKFRGYATGIGWVYGSLINNLWTYSELSQHEKGSPVFEIVTGKYDGDCWSDIAEQEGEAIMSVVPQSVGEFTGITDANGKEIYEGDIIDKTFKWVVAFEDCAFYAKNEYSKAYLLPEIIRKRRIAGCPIEIVGNAYENANMLTRVK